MAPRTKVRIQGSNVPGLSMEVVVPTEWTWAAETARTQYPFEGAQYYVIKSWNTNDAVPSYSQSTSRNRGGGGCGTFLLLIIGAVGLGVLGAGGDKTEPAPAPTPAPIERVAPEPQFRDYASPPPSYCVTENFEPC